MAPKLQGPILYLTVPSAAVHIHGTVMHEAPGQMCAYSSEPMAMHVDEESSESCYKLLKFSKSLFINV